MSKQALRAYPAPALPGEPAYSRIKRWITEHIGSGKLREGDQVPSESELVRLFKVSRMTAHRALRELSAERALNRVQGLGTFVAAPKFAAPVVKIQSIHEEIEARGHRHTSEVLKTGTVRVGDAGVPLALPKEAKIFHVLLLHRENGVPIQVEDRYVNAAIAPEFLRQDFTAVAPGQYLMRVAPISRAEHSIEAAMPERQVARWLKLEANEPCLVLTRFTWSSNLPATFARLFHPGSRYRFTAEW
ncbi:MAG: histidine utilization repressor [Betaproteobacteria bacterium]